MGVRGEGRSHKSVLRLHVGMMCQIGEVVVPCSQFTGCCLIRSHIQLYHVNANNTKTKNESSMPLRVTLAGAQRCSVEGESARPTPRITPRITPPLRPKHRASRVAQSPHRWGHAAWPSTRQVIPLPSPSSPSLSYSTPLPVIPPSLSSSHYRTPSNSLASSFHAIDFNRIHTYIHTYIHPHI